LLPPLVGGVEGGDGDRPRPVQHLQGERGDERLVQVDDVEPLVRQQTPHPRPQPGGNGHVRERAAGREGHGATEHGDVRGRRGPRPGRDQMHHVAARAELPHQVGHVRVHASRHRDVIRRNQRDLHRPRRVGAASPAPVERTVLARVGAGKPVHGGSTSTDAVRRWPAHSSCRNGGRGGAVPGTRHTSTPSAAPRGRHLPAGERPVRSGHRSAAGGASAGGHPGADGGRSRCRRTGASQ
jgi:hypothetical protein